MGGQPQSERWMLTGVGGMGVCLCCGCVALWSPTWSVGQGLGALGPEGMG